MSLCVVVAGNPTEGFRIIGPFKQPHYASEWADEWIDDLGWWVLPLKHEEEVQNETQENRTTAG